jgi:diaminopimelate epimerase
MIKFAKAHAYGNDFLYVRKADVLNIDAGAQPALAREMCDRHAGVGADGLIVYERTPAGAAMTLWNADGSRAEVSGNGVRALAALLLQGDEHPAAPVAIQTDAGVKQLTRLNHVGSRQTFRSSMGRPSEPRQTQIAVGEESLGVVVLNMGNPQCVLLGPIPDDARFRSLGHALEHHAAFPEGTNVEFAHVETPERVRILIWERGVGPTQSSGTGSCAALVAAAAFGGAARDAEVIAPGGPQRVEWLPDSVYLTGWAELLCEGEWMPQFPRTTI